MPARNEGSVREYQRHTTQWGMGKNFDRTGSFGPWMVTADELPRGGKGLKIESRLNGNTMQSSNTDTSCSRWRSRWSISPRA